ncbi:helix-turn-helix domain-containing protein [Cronobacter muytjensii]|uniref:helix-turn-helix domain-containing protein n=1 Tax=Cronobacter muytjensii TaxID=413501 RepID=UPI002DB7D202|nr:helix-turn-helix domain-containing protein [Cronobacter muytjensii]MEB8638626.1 helix-turn-helix domain-containing protein [Cronobacter muytjensii]
MSVKLSAWVWDGCAAQGVKGVKLMVMARLADFSSDEGVCWPSVTTIARQLGAGRSTVITAITQLEKDGWLTRTERRKGQRSATNLYTLNAQKLREAAAAAFQGSETERSHSEHSDSERPDSERPENPAKGASHGSDSGHDPSLKPDPSDKQIPTSENSGESPDAQKLNDFLSRHPDAVVYTPSGKSWGNQGDLDCAGWIFERVKLITPSARSPNWTEWANDVRLMRQIDGRTHREICELFKRASRDKFWCTNILCPSKLREKWDVLTAKFTARTENAQPTTTGESTALREIREARERWERENGVGSVGDHGANLRPAVDCEEWRHAGAALDGADFDYDQRPDDERL